MLVAAGPLRRPLLFWRELKRTFVYETGSISIAGPLKGTSWKWLDLVALCKMVLPQRHRVLKVKYFTTGVSGAV